MYDFPHQVDFRGRDFAIGHSESATQKSDCNSISDVPHINRLRARDLHYARECLRKLEAQGSVALARDTSAMIYRYPIEYQF
jgi:hypothetical protein